MRITRQTVGIHSICISAIALFAGAQNSKLSRSAPDPVPPIIQKMVGDWYLSQRIWRGPEAQATDLPPAVAHRRFLGGTILQEEMTLVPGEKGDQFTRMSYFDYNAVTRQYEYFSIDSRAPQMMNERSYGDETQKEAGDQSLSLWGGIFVAPKWGDAMKPLSDIT